MREDKVLYFSVNCQHVKGFNSWAEEQNIIKPIKWLDDILPNPVLNDLPKIIENQKNKDRLIVIIDYLSLITEIVDERECDEIASLVRLTILQYPEVDFLFDQTDVPDDWLSGIEFLLGKKRESDELSQVAQGFHIFRKDDGFVFSLLRFDNLFDGSNLRWAVRTKYYRNLELENEGGNFEKLQTARKNSLSIVVDDEPRQSRYNGYALYASGYRVILIHTARMLLALNDCIEKGIFSKPQIVVRDFDLQFPDASKKKDYDEETNKYHNTISWDNNWKTIKEKEGKVANLLQFSNKDVPKMIDSIRDYRFYGENSLSNSWEDLYSDRTMSSPFWGWTDDTNGHRTYVYVVTNGHDMMHINHSKYHIWRIKDKWLEVQGIEKPVSGLYYPFFTKLKDETGNPIIRNHFEKSTRYGLRQGRKYAINKKRREHNHGVPVDIYNVVSEMQHRAEKYYEEERFVKAALLAEETIELLNGFHYQMMIKAFQLKFLAENSIAMNVIGADERQLVMDAEMRIKYIKEDIRRIVYPLNKGGKQNWITDIITLFRRRKKEHEILSHIFSDCRDTCRNNEFFDVEAVFIREMAHLDQRDFGFEDIKRYWDHRKYLKLIEREENE